jgi:hypothetical protein
MNWHIYQPGMPIGIAESDFVRSLYGEHGRPPTFPIDTSARFTPAHDVQMILALISSLVDAQAEQVEAGEPPVMVVEIGCNEGQTTADIARTFPAVPVIGVDIPEGSRMVQDQRGEAPAASRLGFRTLGLSNVRILQKPSWELEWSDIRNGLELIGMAGAGLPSLAIDIDRWKIPLVFFIDGDHSYSGVRSDTLLCADMLLRSLGGGMLIWHDDYEGAPDWCGVRRYLSEQGLLRVIRIPDTWVSFAVIPPAIWPTRRRIALRTGA